MTRKLLITILFLFVAQVHAAEKTLSTQAQLHLTVHTKLGPATPGHQATVQRGEIRLTASVTGLPPNSPSPLYQFELWLPESSQTPPQPYKTSGDFTAEPSWSWNPDNDYPGGGGFPFPTGKLLKFVVTAKVAQRLESGVLTAEAGPYKLICDECARRSFQAIADSIITHARCLNCHASGDSPTQGDDRHLHVPAVNRQAVCTQCHGTTNGTTPGSPPGTPEWGMPPVGFSFVNKSAGTLCRQIKDRTRNGGRTMEQLVEHVASDQNIRWAWSPGLQRTKPIGDWQGFALDDYMLQSFKYWVKAGAACPDEEPSSKPIQSAAVPAPMSKPQADTCCTIVPNPAMKGRLGRLVVTYPDGAKTNGTSLTVYKTGNATAIASHYGNQALDLLPGSYEVVITGKRVTGVTIQSGHDTQVKVGSLRITASKNTEASLIDPKNGQSLTSGYGNQEYGLPIGTVNVMIAGQSETVTIQEGKITEF